MPISLITKETLDNMSEKFSYITEMEINQLCQETEIIKIISGQT